MISLMEPLTKNLEIGLLLVEVNRIKKESKLLVLTPAIGYQVSQFGDSNPRPTHYECVALPAELNWR